jgi:DGQHR domain-containing protein
VETYLGIERPLNPKRVEQLMNYVRTVDAAFPSAVIVAVDSRDTRYDPASGVLSLKDDPAVANILDGQHRLAGLEGFDDTFDVIVTVFVDMDIADQALIFATINLEQTKVNKSLAYDLYDYSKHRSPQKTAHYIVRLLDSETGSPLEGKIKILGTAGDPGETISQAAFIEMLMPYVSREPLKDRDQLKRGRSIERASDAESRSLIFRNMFIDERDADIARVLWNFFGAVEDRWGDYWRIVRPGNILNRTTGFRALMMFLPHAYLRLGRPGDVPDRSDFYSIFASVRLDGADFTSDRFVPGTTGQTSLRNFLLSQTSL